MAKYIVRSIVGRSFLSLAVLSSRKYFSLLLNIDLDWQLTKLWNCGVHVSFRNISTTYINKCLLLWLWILLIIIIIVVIIIIIIKRIENNPFIHKCIMSILTVDKQQ